VLWPREHGAWGLLLAPLLLGSIVGARAAAAGHTAAHWGSWTALILAALSLFLLRTPLEARLSHGVMRVATAGERRATESGIFWFATFAVISSVFVLALLPLIPVGLAAVVAASAYGAVWLLSKRHAQTLAAVAMATGAPLACIALTGANAQAALLLFGMSAALAADQVIYVHLQVAALRSDTRDARWRAGWGFFLFQTVIVAALAVSLRTGTLAPVAVIGLAPLLLRGYWHFVRTARRISFRRLGVTELLYTAVAVAGLAAGFHL